MYSATAKITYLNLNEEQREENILLTGIPNFTEAMRQIEDYYGKDLISVQIVMLDESPILISDKTFSEMADFQEIIL